MPFGWQIRLSISSYYQSDIPIPTALKKAFAGAFFCYVGALVALLSTLTVPKDIGTPVAHKFYWLLGLVALVIGLIILWTSNTAAYVDGNNVQLITVCLMTACLTLTCTRGLLSASIECVSVTVHLACDVCVCLLDMHS